MENPRPGNLALTAERLTPAQVTLRGASARLRGSRLRAFVVIPLTDKLLKAGASL